MINADIAESMGTWFDFDSTPFMAPFETNFDRVFLVEHIAGKVHKLRVIASGLWPQASSLKPQASSLKPQASSACTSEAVARLMPLTPRKKAL